MYLLCLYICLGNIFFLSSVSKCFRDDSAYFPAQNSFALLHSSVFVDNMINSRDLTASYSIVM